MGVAEVAADQHCAAPAQQNTLSCSHHDRKGWQQQQLTKNRISALF